jgi:hypothetical protein
MDFQFADIAIGGVALVYLIPRLVEFLKTSAGLSGTRNIWLVAGGLGFLLAALSAALNEGLVPGPALPWIRVVAVGLGGLVAACAAVGDYELNHKD